jgi:hypothetical protein
MASRSSRCRRRRSYDPTERDGPASAISAPNARSARRSASHCRHHPRESHHILVADASLSAASRWTAPSAFTGRCRGPPSCTTATPLPPCGATTSQSRPTDLRRPLVRPVPRSTWTHQTRGGKAREARHVAVIAPTTSRLQRRTMRRSSRPGARQRRLHLVDRGRRPDRRGHARRRHVGGRRDGDRQRWVRAGSAHLARR